MTELEAKIIRAMFREVGAPYIWAGKGDVLWTATGPLVGTITEPHSGTPIHGFDCCGIFAWGLKVAGLKDRRLSHNVGSFMNELEPVTSATALEARPCVAIYGDNNLKPDHMAVLISVYGEIWALEASGGGHLTTTVEAARASDARVRFAKAARRDLICLRKFPVV